MSPSKPASVLSKSKSTKPRKNPSGLKARPKAPAKATPALYEEVITSMYVGDGAITAEQARKLLGWQEEAGEEKFGDSYLLRLEDGTKVRCLNNVINRPLYPAVVKTLKQEHLRRRWRMNGEPIIVGRTGQILNGQHTLVSLILAAKDWSSDDRWKEFWPTEPTMEKLVVFGINEDDTTVNTMDTCKPRSLTEVVFRSEYFADLKPKNRRAVSRMADYAVRFLWHRTGADIDAFAPRRTHAESLDFIARHPRVLECVKYIYEEDDAGKVSRIVSPGYAAGLLYLMGCAKTDPLDYHSANISEKGLDWSLWDTACEFWVLLAGKDKQLLPVHKAIAEILQGGGGSVAERCAIICKAWELYLGKKTITLESVMPDYLDADEGYRKLAEEPTVGGIDGADLGEECVTDPTPEEIRKRAQAVRRRKEGQRRQSPSPSRSRGSWTKGDVAWVYQPGEDPYLGTLQTNPIPCETGGPRVTVLDQSGEEWEEKVEHLSLKSPEE